MRVFLSLNLQHAASQRGSALIVSLILLIVLGMIGLSSMDNALLGEKMAGNTQLKYSFFHAAKGEIEEQFQSADADPSVLKLTSGSTPLTAITSPYNTDLDGAISYKNQYMFIASDPKSITAGTALINEIEVTAIADGSTSGVHSTQIQGVRYILPN